MYVYFCLQVVGPISGGEGLFVGEWAYKHTFTVGKLSVGRRPKKMSCTGGVVHLNSHRNKIIMFRYKVPV